MPSFFNFGFWDPGSEMVLVRASRGLCSLPMTSVTVAILGVPMLPAAKVLFRNDSTRCCILVRGKHRADLDQHVHPHARAAEHSSLVELKSLRASGMAMTAGPSPWFVVYCNWIECYSAAWECHRRSRHTHVLSSVHLSRLTPAVRLWQRCLACACVYLREGSVNHGSMDLAWIGLS